MKLKVEKYYRQALVLIFSIVIALLIGGIIIELTGNDSLEAFFYLFKGAFGGWNRFYEVIVISIPLIFTGLAITFAYKSGMFSIGVDGQLLVGAMAASWFLSTFSELSGVFLIIGSVIISMICGGAWGAIAGMLKAYRKVNEIISTLLMNYIALFLASYLYSGPLAGANSQIPQTEKVPDAAHLPLLVEGTRLHIGLFIALFCAIAVFYVLYNTSTGVKLRAVGINPLAARCNGINVKSYLVGAMFVSGALGGLAGVVELIGTQYRVQDGFCLDFGFDGIAIALIGQLNPIGVLFAAMFFAAIRVGANSMELMTSVSSSISDMIQGIIILMIVAGTALIKKDTVVAKFNKFIKKG